MTTTQKLNNSIMPWLRLLTPILMVLAMFILNNINSNLSVMAVEIKKIGIEQARRTVMVEQSFEHIQDWKIHRRVE